MFVRSFVDVVEFVCVDNTKNDRWIDGWIDGSLELVCAMDATRIERIDVSLFALLNLARWMVLLSLSRVGVVIRAIRGSLCAKGALRQRGLADLCSDTRSISSKYPRRVTFLSQRAGMYQHTSQAVVVVRCSIDRSIDRCTHPCWNSEGLLQ